MRDEFCSFVMAVCGFAGLQTPSAAAQEVAVQAVPETSPATWFSKDNYPPESIRAKEEGRVVVTLDIDANGKVAGCSIFQSSGHSRLDLATCDLALAKGRYAAARDSADRPVASRVTLPAVAWNLPKQPKVEIAEFVRQVGTSEIEMIVGEDGVVESCRPLNTSSPADTSGCELWVGRTPISGFLSEGKPVRARMRLVLATSVEPIDD